MKRYRTIKKDFWGDAKPARVSRDARLLFLGLISHADDHGLLDARPLVLKGQVFSYDETTHAQVAEWLIELHQVGLIRLYGSASEPFAHVVNFHKHQRQRSIQDPMCPAPGRRNSAYFADDDLQAFTALHAPDADSEHANAARKVRESRGDVDLLLVGVGQNAGEPDAPADAPPSTEPTSQPASPSVETCIAQAVEIMVSCSKHVPDAEQSWTDQFTYYHGMRPSIDATLLPAAALRAKARIAESGRPFTVSSGWKYVERAIADLLRERANPSAGSSRFGATAPEPKRRTAAELLAEQDRIWSQPA